MTNRSALALAVAAGYVLGRTKKAKLAFGLGSVVMGKRLGLSPQQLASTLKNQIAANPQLAEIGDQLRDDARGLGKAATGALVTRRMDALTESLRDRTTGVRERLDTGGVTGTLSRDDEHDKHEEAGETGERDERDEDARSEEPRSGEKTPEAAQRKVPRKKVTDKKAASRAPQKKTGQRPVKRTTGAGRRMEGSRRD